MRASLHFTSTSSFSTVGCTWKTEPLGPLIFPLNALLKRGNWMVVVVLGRGGVKEKKWTKKSVDLEEGEKKSVACVRIWVAHSKGTSDDYSEEALEGKICATVFQDNCRGSKTEITHHRNVEIFTYTLKQQPACGSRRRLHTYCQYSRQKRARWRRSLPLSRQQTGSRSAWGPRKRSIHVNHVPPEQSGYI